MQKTRCVPDPGDTPMADGEWQAREDSTNCSRDLGDTIPNLCGLGLGRLGLSDHLEGCPGRRKPPVAKVLWQVMRVHEYTLKELSLLLGLYYLTISVIAGQVEKAPRHKE